MLNSALIFVLKKVKKNTSLSNFIYFFEKIPVDSKTMWNVWQGFHFKNGMQLFKRPKLSIHITLRNWDYSTVKCGHKIIRVSKF